MGEGNIQTERDNDKFVNFSLQVYADNLDKRPTTYFLFPILFHKRSNAIKFFFSYDVFDSLDVPHGTISLRTKTHN